MMSSKSKVFNVEGINISVAQFNSADYISLTEIARHKNSDRTDIIIQN